MDESNMRLPKLIVFLIVAAFLRVPQLSAQGCINLGFGPHGRIIIGTISRAELGVPGKEKVTVTIGEYLRATKFPNDSVDLPVDWTAGPGVPFAFRRPAWYDVLPEVGKHVLIMLYQYRDDAILRPRCVLDLDSSGLTLVPVIRRMVALDELPTEKKVHAMEQALSDPSESVRGLAIHYLTGPTVRAPEVRLHILQKFAPVAADTSRARDQRLEALGFIKFAYDSFSKNGEVNDQILSFVGDRMADPDPEVRSSAVQYLGLS
jgi:hypothetical protein